MSFVIKTDNGYFTGYYVFQGGTMIGGAKNVDDDKVKHYKSFARAAKVEDKICSIEPKFSAWIIEVRDD